MFVCSHAKRPCAWVPACAFALVCVYMCVYVCVPACAFALVCVYTCVFVLAKLWEAQRVRKPGRLQASCKRPAGASSESQSELKTGWGGGGEGGGRGHTTHTHYSLSARSTETSLFSKAAAPPPPPPPPPSEQIAIKDTERFVLAAPWGSRHTAALRSPPQSSPIMHLSGSS